MEYCIRKEVIRALSLMIESYPGLTEDEAYRLKLRIREVAKGLLGLAGRPGLYFGVRELDRCLQAILGEHPLTEYTTLRKAYHLLPTSSRQLAQVTEITVDPRVLCSLAFLSDALTYDSNLNADPGVRELWECEEAIALALIGLSDNGLSFEVRRLHNALSSIFSAHKDDPEWTTHSVLHNAWSLLPEPEKDEVAGLLKAASSSQ